MHPDVCRRFTPLELCSCSERSDRRRLGAMRLLLDYDGTLVPLARSPELAAPDDELMSLLHGLAVRPGIGVDIVSGRPRETMETWFRDLPVTLWAEHGFWQRSAQADTWERATHLSPHCLARVKSILMQVTASTPGSSIEEKSASIAWHYRGVHRRFGRRRADELRMRLGHALSNQPLEVLEGKKVIEVRLRGVSKALAAQRVLAECGPDVKMVAIGDDRTDEDLFRAMTSSAITVAVGQQPTRAAYRVHDYRAVRRLLQILVTVCGGPTGASHVAECVTA